ncbi:hypothetical protein AB4Z21_17955, partial [Paenibacillus sp. MCAF20]
MNVSRSETRQHEKRMRKRRMRRLMILNVTLLTIIAAVIAVWLIGLNMNADKEAGSSNRSEDSGDNQPIEQKQPDDSNGAETSTEEETAPNNNEGNTEAVDSG